MVHGDAFANLIFFSYIEGEKIGRPLGGLDRSRKPFWREFEEYMHEQGESHPTAFDKRQSVTTQAREREKPHQWQCQRGLLQLATSYFSTFYIHTHTHTLVIFLTYSMWPHSTLVLPDQQNQSGQRVFAMCSCVQGHPSSPAQQ